MARQTIEVELGGSGRGPTYHLSNVRCPRRRQLDDEYPSETSLTGGADVRGTVCHAYLADYFQRGNRGLDTREVTFRHKGELWVPDAEAKAKADEMFNAYRVKFPPDEFGKPRGIEQTYKIYEDVELSWKPKGVLLTSQIDLEIEPNQEQCDRLVPDRGVQIVPGVYIVDHKTASNNNPVMAMRYVLDIQNKVYQLVYRTLTGIKPKGGLINVLIGGATIKFRTFMIPPPTEDDEKMIYNLLLQSKIEIDRREESGLALARPTACLDFNRPCHHFTEGRCKRG